MLIRAPCRWLSSSNHRSTWLPRFGQHPSLLDQLLQPDTSPADSDSSSSCSLPLSLFLSSSLPLRTTVSGPTITHQTRQLPLDHLLTTRPHHARRRRRRRRRQLRRIQLPASGPVIIRPRRASSTCQAAFLPRQVSSLPRSRRRVYNASAYIPRPPHHQQSHI